MAFYFNSNKDHYKKILSIDLAYNDIYLVRISHPEFIVSHKWVKQKDIESIKKKIIDLKIVAPWECLDDDYHLSYDKFLKVKKHRESDYG